MSGHYLNLLYGRFVFTPCRIRYHPIIGRYTPWSMLLMVSFNKLRTSNISK